MEVLIRSAQILHPGSTYHKKRKNLLIRSGLIKEIGDKNYRAKKVIEGKDLKVSIGWFDMRANFCDPGFEQKEDLTSGRAAAAAGGFTAVAVLPNTNPVIDSKNEISYLRSGNDDELVQVYPIGAVTESAKGEALTEMIDLHEAGAIAFSDGHLPIWNTDILLKTLLYLQKFNGLLINKPEDIWLNQYGVMHEGVESTLLGMKGMPRLAEEIIIDRDIKLLQYAGGRLHFSNISTGDSVKLIRSAKKKDLPVTSDIAAHQLIFSDKHLENFDTNFKVNPPFREKQDKKSLLKGLSDGTIDTIVSSHSPQDEECKNIEFDLAEFGITGLQTVLPCLLTVAKELDLGTLIEKVTINPRKILELETPSIEVGAEANLTVFDVKEQWEFNEKTNRSKSVNSPFWGSKLTGKVRAVMNNGYSQLFS